MTGLGAPEIVLILLILVLLFGAKKLPELARGGGRALRIFKSETKGLMDEDDDETSTASPPNGATVAPPAQITQATSVPAPQPVVSDPLSYPAVHQPAPPAPPQQLPPTHTEQ